MNIMLFGGRGAGKDTALEYFKQHLQNFEHVRLAGYVVEVAKAFGIDNPTRTQLVLIGETIGRNMIDKNVWINKAIKDIQGKTKDFVISDIRYQNEYDAFLSAGFIPILIDCELNTRIERVIKRDGNIDLSLLEKEGEQAYKKFIPNFIIDNNGSFEDLEKQVVDIIRFLNQVELLEKLEGGK